MLRGVPKAYEACRNIAITRTDPVSGVASVDRC
jgi:hypothetical protein